MRVDRSSLAREARPQGGQHGALFRSGDQIGVAQWRKQAIAVDARELTGLLWPAGPDIVRCGRDKVTVVHAFARGVHVDRARQRQVAPGLPVDPGKPGTPWIEPEPQQRATWRKHARKLVYQRSAGGHHVANMLRQHELERIVVPWQRTTVAGDIAAQLILLRMQAHRGKMASVERQFAIGGTRLYDQCAACGTAHRVGGNACELLAQQRIDITQCKQVVGAGDHKAQRGRR